MLIRIVPLVCLVFFLKSNYTYAENGDGLGAYFTTGYSKLNFTSFERFADSYNAYAMQNAVSPMTKPLDPHESISAWGFGMNAMSNFFYVELGYGRQQNDYTAEFKSGTQHIKFARNNTELATALGIGFNTKSGDCGFIGGGLGVDVQAAKFDAYFDFPNGVRSYGKDHFINGIYRLTLNSTVKPKATIRIIIPIKYVSIFARIDYIIGGEESKIKHVFQDDMKGSGFNGYDLTKELPEDLFTFTNGNFSGSQGVYPNYRGWVYQFGLSFNFLRNI